LPSGTDYIEKIFACPSKRNTLPDSDGNPKWTLAYGMHRYDYQKRSRITNPSEYPMLVDSILNGGYPYFIVRLYTASSGYKVDLRHSGTANILFLDGSVRSFDKSGLEKLGITNYYEH